VHPIIVLHVIGELRSAGSVTALYFLFLIFALKTCSLEGVDE